MTIQQLIDRSKVTTSAFQLFVLDPEWIPARPKANLEFDGLGLRKYFYSYFVPSHFGGSDDHIPDD